MIPDKSGTGSDQMTDPVLFIADEEAEGERVDRYLSAQDISVSRSYIQKIITEGGILVNGKTVKPGTRLKEDDQILLRLPAEKEPDIRPENIPLDILYEDDDLLVVNKPKNMVVHPSAGHAEHTLVNALLYHCQGRLSGINGVLRPGIVHRIDRDTTGALVVCKSDAAHRGLAAQLAAHSITREYRAIATGIIREDSLTIEGNIGRDPKDRKRMAVVKDGSGKAAVTHVTVLERLRGYTYVSCCLETGRTHQIRVHLSHIGHSVLGDPVYGPRRTPVPHLEGQTLHAMTLGFIHPITGKEVLCTAPLPGYFEKLLRMLK